MLSRPWGGPPLLSHENVRLGGPVLTKFGEEGPSPNKNILNPKP